MLDRIDALLKQYRSLAPNAKQITEDFAHRFTYNSNAIEGNTLSEDEVSLIIWHPNSVVSGKPLIHSYDITGHYLALCYVWQQVKSDLPMTEETVLSIHRNVLCGRAADAGKYRKVDVYLHGVDIDLPKPERVPGMMRELLTEKVMMRQAHPIVRAATFHARFEGIHPFVDGNGRTGRLLLNYELLRCGYPPIDIALSERSRYFECLRLYESGEADAQPMIDFIAEHIIKELILRLESLL